MLTLLFIVTGASLILTLVRFNQFDRKWGRVEILLNDLKHQNSEILFHLRKKEEEKTIERSKKPNANRNPRTEEQKQQASLKRKEWWDKKRAQDAAKLPEPEPLNEGMIPESAALVPEEV